MCCIQKLSITLSDFLSGRVSITTSVIGHRYFISVGGLNRTLRSRGQQIPLLKTRKLNTRMDVPTFQTLLGVHSTDKYNMEYNGYLSNHLPHGMVALYRLGAAETRIQQFIDWYNVKLEPSEKEAETKETASPPDLDALLGKRLSFFQILAHYENLLSTKYKTLENLIDGEFPKMTLGISGALLHGMIQLGYGYSVRNKKMVCEGLAYLHHSYRPFVHSGYGSENEFGRGTLDVLEILEKLRLDSEMHVRLMDGSNRGEWKELGLHISGIQLRIGYLLKEEGEMFASFLKQLKVPENLRKASGKFDIEKLSIWVVNVAIIAYVKSSAANNFVLLHGVTCAWSLFQVLPVLSNYQHKLDVIRSYLGLLLATFKANFPTEMNNQLAEENPTQVDWNQIITKAIAMVVDEHIYKLVQVCYDMWKLNPDDGPLYAQAARAATDNEISFNTLTNING